MTPTSRGSTKDQLSDRVAGDIAGGSVVTRGIGLPTLVAHQIPADREMLLHSENGSVVSWWKSNRPTRPGLHSPP
jgi:3-oxoadipate CoA-transferase beta subunit